jgi:hypothetical protein
MAMEKLVGMEKDKVTWFTCFWGHTWTKWHVVSFLRWDRVYQQEYDLDMQQRECISCGEISIKQLQEF